jgi:hypothetical protein
MALLFGGTHCHYGINRCQKFLKYVKQPTGLMMFRLISKYGTEVDPIEMRLVDDKMNYMFNMCVLHTIKWRV